MDFSLLLNRNIYDILIGDEKVYGDYRMPYLSGPNLCQLSTLFGLQRTYQWQGANSSRWEYMQNLMEFLNKQNKIQDLLSFLFKRERFEQLNQLGDVHRINEAHKLIIDGTIRKINVQLLIAGKELRLQNNQFTIAGIDEEVVFEAPKVKIVTSQYIRELPDRIKDDLANNNYDSVLTKSRTLLEEVLIYIIGNCSGTPDLTVN